MDTEPDAPAHPDSTGADGGPGAADVPRTPTATEDMPPVAEKVTEKAEQPPTVRRPAPRKRRWLRALLVVLGILVVAGVAVVLVAPGYLKGRVVEEARARGVLVAFVDAEYSLSKIVLHDVSLALSGVPDFKGKAAIVEVDIVAWEPREVRAGDLQIAMSGTDVLAQLGAWKTQHAAAFSAPLSAKGAAVDWHPEAGAEAAMSFRGVSIAVDGEKGALDVTDARFVGRAAGPTTVTWTMPAEGFVVEIHPLLPPLSNLSAVLRSTKQGPFVRVVLARTALGPLQAALGIPAGSEGLQAEGDIEMPVPSFTRSAPIEASLRLAVKGYVPPHPKELDGILFGDTTTVKAKLAIAANLAGAKIPQVTVEAGALTLTGTGDVAREGLDAKVSLKLNGTIACTALATSAAVAHLGREWGRLAGGLAAGALQGTVAVSLSVEARASDIKGAKIDKSAHLGCRVSIPGLPSIVLE